MSVQITLAFDTTEEAIVALGKLAGIKTRAAKSAQQNSAAAAGETVGGGAAVVVAEKPEQPAAAEPEKKARKPRADAGVPRGPYNKDKPEPAVAPGGATEAASGAPAPSPAPVAAAGSAPQTAAPAAAAPVPSAEDVQKAIEKLFASKGYDGTRDLISRFGVKRGQDIPADQRANFIRRVNGVVDNGEVI